MKGTVRRGDDSDFRFDNWTPGSAMPFEMDVAEEGAYCVEMFYACQPADIGARFKVYTPYDTASAVIDRTDHTLGDTL